jgi:hypothetical protein
VGADGERVDTVRAETGRRILPQRVNRYRGQLERISQRSIRRKAMKKSNGHFLKGTVKRVCGALAAAAVLTITPVLFDGCQNQTGTEQNGQKEYDANSWNINDPADLNGITGTQYDQAGYDRVSNHNRNDLCFTTTEMSSLQAYCFRIFLLTTGAQRIILETT